MDRGASLQGMTSEPGTKDAVDKLGKKLEGMNRENSYEAMHNDAQKLTGILFYFFKKHFGNFFGQIFDQIFGQMFDQVFDQIFDQVFDKKYSVQFYSNPNSGDY